MNLHYKKLCALLAVLIDDDEGLSDIIFNAMLYARTPVSRSRIQGWRVSAEHKNYRVMTSDELFDVLNACLKYFDERQICSMCGYSGVDWLDDGQTCPCCKLVQ